MPHEIKGTGISAFVTLAPPTRMITPLGALKTDAAASTWHGRSARSPSPDSDPLHDGLPKTRSGKIMRRLLRAIASGDEKITQDTTTLEDFSILARLREQDEA
jgi:acetyl-CoA synthetase